MKENLNKISSTKGRYGLFREEFYKKDCISLAINRQYSLGFGGNFFFKNTFVDLKFDENEKRKLKKTWNA